jgi:hypothetical protein
MGEELLNESSVKPYKLEDLMSEEKDSIHNLCRIAHIKKQIRSGTIHPVSYWIKLFTDAFDRTAATFNEGEATKLRTFAARLCKTDPRVIFDRYNWKESMLIARQDTNAWAAARQILGDVWKPEGGTVGANKLEDSPKDSNTKPEDVIDQKVTKEDNQKEHKKRKNESLTDDTEQVSTINKREETPNKNEKVAAIENKKQEDKKTETKPENKLKETSPVSNRKGSETTMTKKGTKEEKPKQRTKDKNPGDPKKGTKEEKPKQRTKDKNPGDTKEELKRKSPAPIHEKEKAATKKKKKQKRDQAEREQQSGVANEESKTQRDLALCWGNNFMKPRMTRYFGQECQRLYSWNLPKNLMDVVGDGNCLFYCLLFHLFRTNRLSVDWKETEPPLEWMRKTIRDGYHRLSEEDWYNQQFATNPEEEREKNSKRVFTEGLDYRKQCGTEDYGEPLDCLVYAKIFGMEVVIYNACIIEGEQQIITHVYDGRGKGACAGMDETCNALVQVKEGIHVPRNNGELLEIVNYRTDEPRGRKRGTGSEHYVMVDWNCHACEKKTYPPIWFQNKGCKDSCENKLLCTQCAMRVNDVNGKIILCRTCGGWKEVWKVRENCDKDCSKKVVCQECLEATTSNRGRQTRSNKKPCVECEKSGDYLLPRNRRARKDNKYACNNCSGVGEYELT